MRNYDFAPLYRATVGFDRIADLVRVMAQALEAAGTSPANALSVARALAAAEVDGQKVALGTELEAPLAELKAEMIATDGVFHRAPHTVRLLSGTAPGGAKFLKP